MLVCWATATARSPLPRSQPGQSSWPWPTSPATAPKDIIYADQGLDRVVVDYGAGRFERAGQPVHRPARPRRRGQLADLNGDGIPDLIVANSGSNNVLIYPGLGNGQFGPAINDGQWLLRGHQPGRDHRGQPHGHACPTWWWPTRAPTRCRSCSTNRRQGGAISFAAGPRLNSGGTGPVSTVVGNFTGSLPDILVTNSQSNDVALLPGVGRGSSTTRTPRASPSAPIPARRFVGNFNGQPDLVTVNAGSNDLTLDLRLHGAGYVDHTIASGGVDPDTAFASAQARVRRPGRRQRRRRRAWPCSREAKRG